MASSPSNSTPSSSSTPIAAVTGASRGIGRATALALAGKGYRVFALARSAGDLAALVREADRLSGTIEAVVLDITNAGSRRAAVDAIMSATDGYGLDVLVNNAGYGQTGPVEEVTVEQLEAQFAVNVFGLHDFTRPFVPPMRDRLTGHIVNVGSIAGRISSPFMGPYSASKFALEALSDALRLELAPWNIAVILIEPGPIRTDFGAVAEPLRPSSPDSPYAPFLKRYGGAKAGTNLFERSPETVARVIVRAVEATRPRPRYTVTLSAKLGTLGRRVVPDVLMDWGFRAAIGLKPNASQRRSRGR